MLDGLLVPKGMADPMNSSVVSQLHRGFRESIGSEPTGFVFFPLSPNADYRHGFCEKA
jgi:hypothetical protein